MNLAMVLQYQRHFHLRISSGIKNGGEVYTSGDKIREREREKHTYIQI